MRFQRWISLFLIVFGLLIAIGTGLKAHFIHNVDNPDLSFTSNPSLSCNIDGYTFTHTRETYSDGVIYTDGWWRRPLDPKVEMSAEAHGFGWAHVLLYGNIDGRKHGDDTNTTPHKLGSWLGIAPLSVGIDHTISADFYDDFNRSYKTYTWDASGSVKLVPVYWKWRLTGVVPSGSWEEASSDFHTTQTASGGGNWLVEKNWTTLSRPSPSSNAGGGSGSGSGNGSGSGSVSGSGTGCSQALYGDYCTDTGVCSTRSTSGVPGECGQNWCCCAGSYAPTYDSVNPDGGSSSDDGSSDDSNTLGCGHSASAPGDHTSYGCTLTGCGAIYYGCQGPHTSYHSCGNCGAGYSTCENVSPTYCWDCGESL